MTRREFEDLKAADFDRLEAEVARLTQENAALVVALAQLREACLEDIGGRHEEIQCAICLRYWPIAGPPQHDATCILAADQPTAVGAELLAAAEEDQIFVALVGIASWMSKQPPANDRSRQTMQTAARVTLEKLARARAGQRAAGPGREGE